MLLKRFMAIFSADFCRAKTESCVLVKPQKINPRLIKIFHEMPLEKLPGFEPQCVWGLLGFNKQTKRDGGIHALDVRVGVGVR